MFACVGISVINKSRILVKQTQSHHHRRDFRYQLIYRNPEIISEYLSKMAPKVVRITGRGR